MCRKYIGVCNSASHDSSNFIAQALLSCPLSRLLRSNHYSAQVPHSASGGDLAFSAGAL